MDYAEIMKGSLILTMQFMIFMIPVMAFLIWKMSKISGVTKIELERIYKHHGFSDQGDIVAINYAYPKHGWNAAIHMITEIHPYTKLEKL